MRKRRKKKMPKPKEKNTHWAVFVGRKTGVFDSWPAAQEQTNGYHGGTCKAYTSYELAKEAYKDDQKRRQGPQNLALNTGPMTLTDSEDSAPPTPKKKSGTPVKQGLKHLGQNQKRSRSNEVLPFE